MKHMKKFMALFAALALVLAMAVPAFADDGSGSTPTTHKISVPDNSPHAYKVYQIFTGDYSKDADGVVKLSNIKWGENGTGAKGDAVDETVLTALSAVNSSTSTDEQKLTTIKNYVKLNSTPVATVNSTASYDAPLGYYLFEDTTITGENKMYTVEVVGEDVVIQAKDSHIPGFEKKLKDINDTTDNNYSNWQDIADHDIGDKVPFKLEGTVAADYAEYKGKYYFAFHDVAENGLTFNNDVKVYVDDTEITTGFEVKRNTESETTDGCTFEVIFSDLKSLTGVTVQAGSKIRVEYTATLNENAVIGGSGNLNKARLEYSNKPNETQNGNDKPSTDKTPWDSVLVFTYKVVVNKYANSVDAEGNNKLTGAEFTLEKVLKDGTTKTIAVVKSDDGTAFTFKGLDDGNYILTETKTPAGYNTIDPITFTVTADHTSDNWDGANRAGQLTRISGNKVTGEIDFTETTSDGTLSTNVINKSGTTLPGTGGIGTTIFYVIGGGLMVAAAVLLVAKKRMENK